MNTNTNTVVSNQNRGRIAFWNILAYMFAGLAAFTLIRGGHDLVANIATAVLATLMLLCLLARFSVQYPASFSQTAGFASRGNRASYQQETPSVFDDEDCSTEPAINPATGLLMVGMVDSAGNGYGTGFHDHDD